MKRLVITIIAISLIIILAACNKQEQPVATDTVAPTPAATRTPMPSPTPPPMLQPDKIMAQHSGIYKIYDNGEYGYFGYHSIEDKLEYYEDLYKERMIQKDTIKAGIPVIVDSSWDYDRITAAKHQAIMSSHVDKDDYDKRYGDKIKEIKARYKVDETLDSVHIKGFAKRNDNKVYLLDVDGRNVVYAHFGYCAGGGEYYDYCNRDMFSGNNIIDVGMAKYHVVGLTEDGKVLSHMMDEPEIVSIESFAFGQEETEEWSDIIDVSAGSMHTLALKRDGTVVACGDNNYGQLDVTDWEEIVAIEAGNYSSFGIKKDGTVVVAGANRGVKYNIGGWSDIVEIKTGDNAVAGRNSTGDVYVSGGSTQKENLVWDISSSPIFFNVISMDFLHDTLVVLDDKGSPHVASVHDYLFNTDRFSSDVDDIAPINTNSFAIKKGRTLISGSKDKVNRNWDTVLKNEDTYDVLSYVELVDVEINGDGDLVVIEKQNQKRKGLFNHEKKITDYRQIDIFGRKYIVVTEDDNAYYVDCDYTDMSFKHHLVFDSSLQGAKIKKIFVNKQVVALLDDKGFVHNPDIIKRSLNSDLVDIDWDHRTNWDRDKDDSLKDDVGKDAMIVELANWTEFEKLFDGKLPKLKRGLADSFYKSQGKTNATAGAWFVDCSQKEFDNYLKLLTSSGFELDSERESVIVDSDGEKLPIIIKELIYKETGAGLEVDITDYGEQKDISLAFSISKSQ